jgi:dihydroorotase
MEILIKNARVVDVSQDFLGDVYIKEGKIKEIGNSLSKQCEIIDGEGYILMPSFVDLHCHFRDPGLTYKEDLLTGSKAAVKGGYTAVNLMANTKPICSDTETLKYVLEKGKDIGLVDIHQTVSITRNLDGNTLSHLDDFNNKGPEDYTTIRFISDDGKGVYDSAVMYRAMNKAKEKNMTIMCHAESPELSAIDMRMAENMMTWRDIELAKATGASLHLAHVSTIEAMSYVIDAKRKGLEVTCEVTPHHIALTEEVSYRVNPPLRKSEDVDFLIQAIKDGYVDAIATDHAPHSEEDKKNGSPGMVGLETSFAVCYTALVKSGKVSLNKLSEIMSSRPAAIMGVNKGKVSIGFDGDLVLVDIDNKYKINTNDFASKGVNTPFKGYEVYGEVLKTIKGGKVVYSK